MTWRPFRRKPALDLEKLRRMLHGSVAGRDHSNLHVAQDFRALFLNNDPELGKRVLFMILTWCGEYDLETPGKEDLERWAGKRDIAGKIKAALYADLSKQD